MIAYLKSLQKQTFVPLPTFEEEKKTLYNLDLNKLAENEIQIIVTNIDGIKKNTIFRLYVIDKKHHRFQAIVNEGRQTPNLSVTLKIPQNIMDEIIKGTD